MRLWHTRIITVLPRLQLLAQWRECCSIYAKQDKHRLINFIYTYPDEHFYSYSQEIIEEMKKRGYRVSPAAMERCNRYFENRFVKRIDTQHIFKHKMTPRYLRQCYYNLQEKFDCGAIEVKEWDKIQSYLKSQYLQIYNESID